MRMSVVRSLECEETEMHTADISKWTHHHRFETGNEAAAERRTLVVVALTLTMMIAEIAVGLLTNSMALPRSMN